MPEIPQLQLARIKVPIVGTTPLLTDNWAEWDLENLRLANAKKTPIKAVRTPEQQYLATLYRIAKEDGAGGYFAEGYGFPASGFWKATIGASRYYGKTLPMTQLRQNIRVHGVMTKADKQPLTEIFGKHQLREDRIGTRGQGGGSQLTYRAEFPEWSATLEVEYVLTSIQEETVLSLIYGGGVGVGVGNWRPEKGGTFGTYVLDESRDIERLS
jgi:hypothetical protein